MSRRLSASWAGAGAASARGFTLIEALVVVAILALLVALASPSFVTVIGTINTKAAAFDLIGDLTMARSEALKRNLRIRLLPLNKAWTNGWQVCEVEAAEANDVDKDECDPPLVLRQRPRPASNIAISAPVGGVLFQPNGRLQATEVDTANLSWSVTSSISGVLARCVVLSPTGSARSRPGACS